MARGGHGLSKASLGPAMPYTLQAATLKQAYGCFRGGHQQGERSLAIFYPLGYPTPYASETGFEPAMQLWKPKSINDSTLRTNIHSDENSY